MSHPILRRLVLSAGALISVSQASVQNRANAPTHAEWFDSPITTGMLGVKKFMKDVPPYVLEFAPLVHLSEDEVYWPSVMDEHLLHTTPYLNSTPSRKDERHPTASNLGDFNKYDEGTFVYLQSKDDVQTNPAWLTSEHNIPVPPPDSPVDEETAIREDNSKSGGKRKKVSKKGGRSSAPAFLLVADRGDGVVDAFWFFFYSYNLGNTVFGVGFGDHVGDWEHSNVRFKNGVPESVFVSEHAFGQTYAFSAMEKYGKRPVIYSARGTHALYPTPGIQAYILPFAILHDTTSRGPLWDPSLNLLSYHYTSPNDASDMILKSFIPATVRASESIQNILIPSLQNPNAPTSWFYYGGCWGDKEYPASDPRQYHVPIIGEKKFVDGAFGPRFKALGRHKVCPYGSCKPRTTIAPRLWVMNWLYNWAWTCGCFLALVVMGIVGFTVGRHAHRGHGRWRAARRQKYKGLEDVEENPLTSEATSEVTSILGVDADVGFRDYGTIGEVVREREDRVG